MKLSYLLLLLVINVAIAQNQKTKLAAQVTPPVSDTVFAGLKFRNIGPAITSGRIADITIDSHDENTWFMASASGGVWKTTNAGTTLTPVFDEQKSYSIGCVTIDPSNSNVVWVGSGENVGGRHVGYGDGIYKSEDGGVHWKNMGLKNSEHISRILVNPKNSDIIWVAAQGPLWSKGGDRGIYKTTDGGNTWKRTLGDAEWVGATEIVMDPRNPDVLYAATWQRHRTISALMDGGPGSGLHRSTNGGETWTKLTNGLPTGDMGKIGLAISLQQPDVLYADIELEMKKGGLYRSADKGSSWEKKSDVISGGTGPHYYQELYASPHVFDRIYLMHYAILVSEDGGKTFKEMNTEHRHVDNHAITFKKSDPNYLLIGTDGGLYESFDLAKTWRFFENLPLTQFYKVALDDKEPFYNIYGGSQDNGTQGGPSRTDKVNGIQNSDWSIVLDWDGYQPATEPGNPNIVYAQRQEGNMSRIDMANGEVVDIQPQAELNENFERFNWDAPILVSPHNPARIYHASQRVWRSDNRGDQWTAISPDLTRNEERFSLPIMGKNQSWNEPWDLGAMSNYNTITSISESPKQEGLIYIGTDDGLIQVTENGGSAWRKFEVGSISGVPATSFINDIKADLFDANTVYAALDNHKSGDYTPYLIRSNDRGKTWQSIRSNLPDRTLIWRLVQDHIKKELMFVATEFGIYFTINNGNNWIKLTGGVPTISFRDIAIQKRENDLVAASFGRGFFVLDDYSALREANDKMLTSEATLFPTRKAWWYIQRSHLNFTGGRGDQGADHFVGENPPHGATITYYLRDGYKTKEDIRKQREKPLKSQNKNVPWPGWNVIEAEQREEAPKIVIVIKDASGSVVRKLDGPAEKGIHRVSWDMKYPAPEVLSLSGKEFSFGQMPGGLLAIPGIYSVTLYKQQDGVVTELAKPMPLVLEQLYKSSLPNAGPQAAATFWRSYEMTVQRVSAIEMSADQALTKILFMKKAVKLAKTNPGDLDVQVNRLHNELLDLNKQIFGDPVKEKVGEKSRTTIGARLFALNRGLYHSTYGPTSTHKHTLEMVNKEANELQSNLQAITTKMNVLLKQLIDAGAPYVDGLPDK